MARIWGYFRSWGSALTKSGLWVVIAAVGGVVFVMWLAGTGFLPTGKKSAWPPKAATSSASSPAVEGGACRGQGCAVQTREPRPDDRDSPSGGRDVYRTASAQGYDAAPEGACANDEPPPWGAPEWKNCGVRCMYERLRNGFCGPGCDYYYFRLKEYKPRRFYARKPCYRVP